MPDAAALESLRARVRAIEGGGVDFGRAVARLGEPLDAALSWGGLPYRALHEISGLAATSAWRVAAGWSGAATPGSRPSWVSSMGRALPASALPRSG